MKMRTANGLIRSGRMSILQVSEPSAVRRQASSCWIASHLGLVGMREGGGRLIVCSIVGLLDAPYIRQETIDMKYWDDSDSIITVLISTLGLVPCVYEPSIRYNTSPVLPPHVLLSGRIPCTLTISGCLQSSLMPFLHRTLPIILHI